mmetsp:Transcript_27875/g.52537  ORF Transcript_27875/g.52537 Transcript_27875/m.52537 type:complete len:966 (-) Transcript_27875:599-3496(-)|eukprot:CAMPEP_0201677792 /NCGR_PEP_ID=MMETSP0494-20130426/44855_1 /ASSEMBLY_ACC=CAM_ASM_000839 /TAXON_ID=420259 /ORGANISM="Thalassiosira gravida, Strain GMp14c1" /LENGTH=965 /DNA_ID=CAMNT_0048160819 /DNA_START=257 /DNA_END=3154 /DNA_ORIENTATION=+
MSKSISPPLPSSSAVSSSGGGGGNSFHSSASVSSSNNANNNMPPRPQIPPGHNSPVRTPHAHDVLSGRGGRINSHPGNIRFREMVDAYKREYLDPRTKKVEKARIAARIVNTIRTLDPKGKFLKEDPHTGLWVEIGDERAWKKAGQALRESAPEIRAERQAQLQMMAGVPVSGVGGGSVGGSVLDSGGGGGGGGGGNNKSGRKSRQADPPGPRHRPNPPAREGLGRSSTANSSRNSNNNSNFDEISPRSSTGGRQNQQQLQNQIPNQMQGLPIDEDLELVRMRQEYLQMQRLQQEQQRRMLQYQSRLQQQAERGGNNNNQGRINNNNSNRDVYDEYRQMKQDLLGSYRQQVHQSAQAQLLMNRAQQQTGSAGGGEPPQSSNGQRHQNHRDIAAAIMDDGLLPVNAGFDIPALRGEQGHTSWQQYQQQQTQHAAQQQNNNSYRNDYSNAIQAQEVFDRNFNSCDKTVSTMSSFDIQSVDMSSLGGLSWREQSHSNYNMSGLISTGSTQMSSNRHNNYNASGNNTRRRDGAGKSGAQGKSNGKSALERKLEKVNDAHRRQQMQDVQLKTEQMPQAQDQVLQQPMPHQPHPQGGITAATAGGVDQQQQQKRQRISSNSSSNNNGINNHGIMRHSQEPNHNMSSLNSFGFEAIEEDELTEASYKMSNLGLSGLSEMDMTIGSDVLSVRSKSPTKVRTSSQGESGSGTKGGASRGKVITDQQKQSNSEGDSEEAPARVTASNGFNHSLSSTRSSGADVMNKKGSPHNFSMEDFNESFKSMEMEDRTRASGATNGIDVYDSSQHKPSSQRLHRRLPDPDGEVGGQQEHHASMAPPPPSSSRRKDPNGGRLPSIHSSRASNHGAATSDVRLSSSAFSSSRRESVESMGISDPDMLRSADLGNSNTDFGVSVESLRSFQSQGSDASSWLNQYNSMENVGSDKNPWDDEDQASGGTSTSEISAPRMVMATGGDA